tara:strand:+ start:250 stop:387 length:138 start_codon:yes stop_codon:yes gene_type:complete
VGGCDVTKRVLFLVNRHILELESKSCPPKWPYFEAKFLSILKWDM